MFAFLEIGSPFTHLGFYIDADPVSYTHLTEGEEAQLLEDIKSGKSVEREPVYSQTANSHGENDYGNSYVEINLTSQHLFVYKNGSLVVDSDFVSGNLSKGHGSPTGAFSVTYTTTDAVLRGEDSVSYTHLARWQFLRAESRDSHFPADRRQTWLSFPC